MANEFYDHGAYPAPNSLATSTELRAEFDLVEAGFNKLPTMAANAGKKVIVNPTSDALTVEDDNATNVSFTPTGSIAATNVQAAIQELDSEKQPIDAELTAIAGLATTDSNFIVGNGSTWVAESGATARTSLGLGNVDNTSDTTKNAASVTLTNKTIVAANNTITTAPSGNLTSTSLNAALAELQTDVDTRQLASTAVTKDSSTGAALLPVGTSIQQPASPVKGMLRYNDDTDTFEGYIEGSGWGQVGGGQMYGTATNKAIFFNSNLINENINIIAGQNGGSFGPIEIANGKTVTIADGATWTIV